MIITRTPYRCSLLGGGTDHPEHFLQYGGAVLTTAINLYSYILLREVQIYEKPRFIIRYSKVEEVDQIEEIKHPSIRECFRYMAIKRGITLSHDGDLPARSGIGSSSSFTVGLLQGLHKMDRKETTPALLSSLAIDLERNAMQECVGYQDQTIAAYGGLCKITFSTDGKTEVTPIDLAKEKRRDFFRYLMLVYTGIQRLSSPIEKRKLAFYSARVSQLKELTDLAEQGKQALLAGSWEAFGKLLHYAWLIKKTLSPYVSSSLIDSLYETAKRNGALGGKLLGAGGGGFLLLFASPPALSFLRDEVFTNHTCVQFGPDTEGSKVIYDSREVQ